MLISIVSKTMITRPLKFSLRLIGVWPDSSCKILQRVLWAIILGTGITFQIWYCIPYFETADLPDLLEGLIVILSNTVTYIKIIILWFNYRTLFTVLTIVFEDWNNRTITDRNKQFMVDNSLISSRISNSLIVIYSTTCILYAVSTMFSEDADEEVNPNERKLLLKMKFPFEATASPLYEFIIIVQFILEYSTAFVASMLMALFAALWQIYTQTVKVVVSNPVKGRSTFDNKNVYDAIECFVRATEKSLTLTFQGIIFGNFVLHIGSQIDIACQELTELSDRREEEASCLLKSIVAKHQRIIHLFENIRQLFLYSSLVQFLANVLVISFLGFILVTSLGTEEGPTILAKCLPYYVAVNCESFVLCYIGEYLTTKGENIGRAAYNVLWYNIRPRDSRMVLLILLRAQRQLTLTAGKFVILCVETFANMIKAAASYNSILLAMY